MRKGIRLRALLLAALLLTAFVPLRAQASTTVYFTAVNDTLLDLNDQTMPFWKDGVLYVSSTAVDRTDLGTSCSYNPESMIALVIKQRKVLNCDLSAGTIEDNTTHERYSGSAIVKGDTVFFPVAVLAKFFDLKYSCTKITYGYLVRLRNDNAVLSDSLFIDAASQPFQQRYLQYERKSAAQTPDTPDSSTEQSGGNRSSLTVYPLVEMTDAASGAQVIEQFGHGRATLLFSPDTLAELGGLARRTAGSGCSVALSLRAETAEEALSEIARGNALLWECANLQTRLVYLPGASAELCAALTEAGYCPISSAADLSRAGTQTAQRILDTAGSRRSLRVYLGTDSAIRTTLGNTLNRLRTEQCTLTSLTEVTA